MEKDLARVQGPLWVAAGPSSNLGAAQGLSLWLGNQGQALTSKESGGLDA